MPRSPWHHRFVFPPWALHINELTPELLAKLPPTDDRLRTDMRLFEHGYYAEASGAGHNTSVTCCLSDGSSKAL